MGNDKIIYIAHRGNINGPNPNKENHPDYIIDTLNIGFHCEIDIWSINNQLFLGHDSPQYKIDIKFLMSNKIWCHCKNEQALSFLKNYKNIHYFWHQNDDYTITSKGYIWTFPGKTLIPGSICVMPELFPNQKIPLFVKGICSDFIEEYLTNSTKF